MTDYSKMKVRIYGYGLFECFMGQRLAEDFGKVEVYIPWEGSYPTPDKAWIGKGIPGISRIYNFNDNIDDVDLFCFFDVGRGDLQEDLRKRGKRVFGTGKAERLEFDRVYFKEQLKKVGLPVGRYRVVKGIDDLRALLKKENNLFIKVSMFRGVAETFHHETYMKSLVWLDGVSQRLGGLRLDWPFIVEDPVEGVEGGADWFYTDDGYLPIGMLGWEAKDLGYVCRVMRHDELPKPLREVNDKIEPLMRRFKVRGAFSSEVRDDGKGKGPHFIDFCSRLGSPPSEIISGMYSNLAEIIYRVAGGEMVEPKPISKYAAEILLKSPTGKTEWLPISYPKKYEKSLKFRNACIKQGQLFYIPQDGGTIIGAAVGYADTMEEAQVLALEAAESVEADEIYFDPTVFDTTDEYITEASRKGFGKF